MNQIQNQMKKVAVVSAIFFINKDVNGKPGPFIKNPNWDYIVFTNDKQKLTTKYNLTGAWEIREVQPYRNDEKYATKYIKWMTHIYLPEYETVIWVDSIFIPNPEKVEEINEIINHTNHHPNSPIFMRPQPPQQGIKNVQEDIDHCYNQNRMDIKMKNRTETFLKNKGFDLEKDHSVYWSSSIIKSNTNKKLQQMSEELFGLINHISFHDQHWLPFLLQKHRIHANLITDQRIFIQNGSQNGMQNSQEYYKHIKKVYISNNYYPFHCELMPSIIEKFRDIIRDKDVSEVEYKIYMTFNVDYPYKEDFVMFIRNKFPNVNLAITEEYDYKIDCTIYPEDKKNLIDDEKHFYISHEIFDYGIPNVFYLSPQCKGMSGFEDNYLQCDVMAFYKRKCMNRDIPVYIIQGNMNPERRDYDLLEVLLKTDFKRPYAIKIIGGGKLDTRFSKYRDSGKLIVKTRLNYCDYHREFLDGYCILPLVSRKKQPEYYDTKFMSSIHYGLAFDLHFLLDTELRDIYELRLEKCFAYESSAGGENREKGMVDAFRQSLEAFYSRV